MASDSRPWWERIYQDSFGGSLPSSSPPRPSPSPPLLLQHFPRQGVKSTLAVQPRPKFKAPRPTAASTGGWSRRPSAEDLAFVRRVTLNGQSFRCRRQQLVQRAMDRVSAPRARGWGHKKSLQSLPSAPLPVRRLPLTQAPFNAQRLVPPQHFGTPASSARILPRLPVMGSDGSGVCGPRDPQPSQEQRIAVFASVASAAGAPPSRARPQCPVPRSC